MTPVEKLIDAGNGLSAISAHCAAAIVAGAIHDASSENPARNRMRGHEVHLRGYLNVAKELPHVDEHDQAVRAWIKMALSAIEEIEDTCHV